MLLAKITWHDEYVEVTGAPLKGIDMDMNHIPDAAMTIATTALFAQGPTSITNIYNWRVKETDRLNAMATELRKLGAVVAMVMAASGIWFISMSIPLSGAPVTSTYSSCQVILAPSSVDGIVHKAKFRFKNNTL